MRGSTLGRTLRVTSQLTRPMPGWLAISRVGRASRSSSEFDQPALCARAINGQARARVNSRARLR